MIQQGIRHIRYRCYSLYATWGFLFAVCTLVSCAARPEQSLAPTWLYEAVLQRGEDTIIVGFATGDTEQKARQIAAVTARAEAMRMRKIHIYSSRQEYTQGQKWTDGTDREQTWATRWDEHVRQTASGKIHGSRIVETQTWTQNLQQHAAVRLAVPTLALRAAAAMQAAGTDVKALMHLHKRFVSLEMYAWAADCIEKSASIQTDNAEVALRCARWLWQQHMGLGAQRWLDLARQRNNQKNTNAGITIAIRDFATQMGRPVKASVALRKIEALVDMARNTDQFSAQVISVGRIHWTITGTERRIYALWEDGEDIARLHLQDGATPEALTGLVRTDLTLAQGQQGNLMAFLLPATHPIFYRAEQLPIHGISLSGDASDVERRLLLDIYRVLESSVTSGDAETLRVHVSGP